MVRPPIATSRRLVVANGLLALTLALVAAALVTIPTPANFDLRRTELPDLWMTRAPLQVTGGAPSYARESDRSVPSDAYSQQEERAIGKRTAKLLDERFRLISDAEVNRYVNGIVQTMVRAAGVDIPVTVKLAEDDNDVNAYCLPGGFIY